MVHDAGTGLRVAVNARDGTRRRAHARGPQAGLLGAPRGLEPLDKDQRDQEEASHRPDDPAFRFK